MSKFFTVFACIMMFQLPAEAKKISGEAIVDIAEDFQTKKSEMIYSVRDSVTQKVQRINFKTAQFPMWFQTGKKVVVEVSETARSIDAADVYAISAVEGQVPDAAMYVTAERKALILRVSAPDGQPYVDQATVLSYMYNAANSVYNYYLSRTRGKFTFIGDAAGDGQQDIVDVSIASSVGGTCDYNVWATEANAEAAKQGVTLSLYQHFIYVLPNASVNCHWSGLANVGGSRSWVRHGGIRVYAHELGHNLGLHHSSHDPENDGVYNYEYGDGSCMMGAGVTNFNSVYTERLGIFSAWPGQIVVGSAGEFQLSPLAADPATAPHPQIIKLKKPNGSYYYFSLRTQAGLDASMSVSYARGVSIHTYTGGRAVYIKTIAPGEIFEDAANGIAVVANAFGADGQSIGMQINAVCASASPQLSLNAANVYADASGKAVLAFTIKNNDGVYCPATTFSLAGSAPGGVAITSASSVTVLPGATATGSIELQASASLGAFNFSFNASDLDGKSPEHGSLSSSALVAFDLTAPSVVSITSLSSRKGKVSLAWTASSDSGSGVVEYRVYRNGVLAGSATSTSFVEYNLPSGSYSYTVMAVDAAGNVSAASAPEILNTTKATGGKGRR